MHAIIRPRRSARLLPALIAGSLLAACGGGGGFDDAAPNGGYNGGLAGSLYFDRPTDYAELDLDAGTFTTIFADAGNGTTPSADASEFVNVQDTPGSSTSEDIVVFRRDGRQTARIVAGRDDLDGYPRLSPSGTLIAQSVGSGASTRLYVIDRTGAQKAIYDPGSASYSWRPDNTLSILIGETLYYTDTNLQLGAAVVTFNGLAPSGVSVSPDGTRFAVVLGDGSTSARHVWVLDADGGNPRQVTDSQLSESGPNWSPDGTLLVLTKGIATASSCPELWVVPAAADKATLLDASPAPAQRVLSPSSVNGEPAGTCGFSPAYWKP